MIRRLLGLLLHRLTLTVLGLLAAALLIWIAGPLLGFGQARPLASSGARLVLIGVLVALTLGLELWRTWRARRANRRMVDQLMAPAPGAAASAEAPDLAALRERFERALQVLRRARFPAAEGGTGGGGLLHRLGLDRLGGRYVYQLPWYVIVGAPGSGKTTALRNAGLQFPLAELSGDPRMDPRLRGIGGTRDCDWWFTDRAVLIDTAGRFTTQDSDAARDQAGWLGFLELLRQARPRRPLNGVLVTVSVADLLSRGPAEIDAYAERVRLRVAELQTRLGSRFPVYLLVTKTDLLSGFGDYFASLDKDARATPWGLSFERERSQAGDHGALAGELRALTQRLQEGLVRRLQAETDPQRRARIYGFPLQFASLHEPLEAFVRLAFAPSAFETPAQLRGVYFVSGTQEGTPIDRLMGAIARNWQLERAILPPQAGHARSYFLERLLNEVVFAEAGLAGVPTRWARRRRLLLLGSAVAVGLLGALVLLAWTGSWLNNRSYIDAVQAQVEEVRRLVQVAPNRAGTDLLPLLPALDATRTLAQAGLPPGTTPADPPLSLGAGLFQGDKLDAAAQRAYERMLVEAVLPRLALRIEEQLRQRGDAPELQYESLKAYLMLQDPQRFDAAALAALIRADWAQNLPRGVDAATRARLDTHLDALLALGAVVSPLRLDAELVAQTRARLAALPLPQRIYERLRQRGLRQPAAEFNAATAGGPAAALVFARASGNPLNRGVPALYTYDGYHQGFQKSVDAVARELAEEEGWVLAREGAQPAPARLADEVRRLYFADYIAAWEAYLADVRLRPSKGADDLVQLTRVLVGPDKPLATYLLAAVRETTLLGLPGQPGAAGVGKEVLDKAQGAVSTVRKELLKLGGVEPAAGGDTGEPPEAVVDQRFALLRRYVLAPPGGKAPMDDTLVLLNEAAMYLASVKQAIDTGQAPPPSDMPVRLSAAGAQAAEPVRGLLAAVSANVASIVGLMQRDVLSREVRSAVGEFCQQAAAGRYPLARGSTQDMTPADFGQLFGPGGRFDQMQQRLAPLVDTTRRPWKFRNDALGEDAGTLPQFQRAQVIRETFFAGGGNLPSMRLEFRPVEMDASITQFVLDIDGQVVRYAHGPQIPMTVTWPGPRGSNQVRLQFTPAGASGGGTLSEGPWALMHLFDRVRIEPGRSPERFRATFELDGRRAVFDVTASSVRNPLQLRELAEFNCPNGL